MAGGKLILVAKLKGGSGATTTCRELAAAALQDGRKVALIDLDGQGGLSRWWNRRTAPAAEGDVQRAAPDLLQLTATQIPGAANGLRQRYDLVVIDSPPSVHETIRAVAAVSDLALIPSRPTVDDLDAVGPIARLLHGVVDHGFVLTHSGRPWITGWCRSPPAACGTGACVGPHQVSQRLQPAAWLRRYWLRGRPRGKGGNR
jgi:chromosome partitioning protein